MTLAPANSSSRGLERTAACLAAAHALLGLGTLALSAYGFYDYATDTSEGSLDGLTFFFGIGFGIAGAGTLAFATLAMSLRRRPRAGQVLALLASVWTGLWLFLVSSTTLFSAVLLVPGALFVCVVLELTRPTPHLQR